MIPEIKKYDLNVTKKSGEKAPFDPQKIYYSLKGVGVDDHTAEVIIRAVKLEAYEGITTKEIYKKTFNLLRKYSKGSSVRYRLKDAITQLGNTGYPFERFVGDLFVEKGYDVKVGMVLKGFAVTHEIDVVAQNHERIFTVECKYHVNPAAKSDVKVPMYILSRYRDLENAWSQYQEFKGKVYQQWIATNTRFTNDAITFAEAYGLKILSWDYPKGQGLKDWIQLYGMFPITCLSCLTKAEKELLIAKGLVCCRTIYKNPHLLDGLSMPENKKSVLKKELNYLYESVLSEGEHVF
ncbi:MAG: restriction endonuclease [Flavobacteriales bacterium]|nr:restriction endonuclease [Flavobacteriales bacterium]